MEPEGSRRSAPRGFALLRARDGGNGASLLAVVAALGSFGGCARGAHPQSAPPPAVVTAPVRSETIAITNDFQGTSGAIESVDVRARVEGVLEAVYFKEGSLVRKGQLIATLQKDQYQASLLSTQGQVQSAQASLRQAENSTAVQEQRANVAAKQAQLEQANTTVARTRPLVADKALPQKNLDNALSMQASAVAELDGAKAQLANAEVSRTGSIETAKASVITARAAQANAKINLGYTDVYAPVTGLIGFLKEDVGNVVGDTPSTQVFDTITSVDPIKVDFAVDEGTYLAVAGARRAPQVTSLRDQSLRWILADNSVYPYPGRLYAVNPTLDSKTGTIQVEARFPNPNGVLRPGQFARIRLVVERRPNVLLVPQTAVVAVQGTNTVYTVDQHNLVAVRSVTLGPQHGDDVVIESGLRPGQVVIVEGWQKVKPGEAVAPQATR